nr:MAG TPA: hypothetical protein [Caudoviricetes sp.]
MQQFGSITKIVCNHFIEVCNHFTLFWRSVN